MGGLSRHNNNNNDDEQVSIIMVPFPAQGHLNQLLQLSCLIVSASATDIPVHYVASAVHNRQAQSRINGLNPHHVAKIHFHDLPILPFPSPAPDPKSSHKFPKQLQPAFDATLSLRQPLADYVRTLAGKYRRVVVIHDLLIAAVVQDVASIPNAESYAFICLSAFCQVKFLFEQMGKTPPFPRLSELPRIATTTSDELQVFINMQNEAMSCRSGDIYNTCRMLEAPFLDVLDSEEVSGDLKSWAIGPFLPPKLSSNQLKRESYFDWLDKQEANSVVYVTFGTTTCLSDEEITELATGLEKSGQKFIWVLRDADRADVFSGEARRVELPEGFEERISGEGIVVREWAPQPEILAHPAVGGFISHCGWNSCVESITMGVPIAAWPMHSDQPTNAVLVTEVLKMGFLVTDGSGEAVKAETVANVVRRMMVTEEGEVIRKRAEELAGVLRRAAEEGGASRVELEDFIRRITRE